MKYRLLILAATLIWGSSFVIVKDAVGYITPAWLLVFRFVIATLVLAMVFLKWRKLYFDRDHMLPGIGIGLTLFAAYLLQTIGITDTTPGKNAFLTGAYCVMVPFLTWAIMKKKPNSFNVIAAVVCLAGIGLISLDGGLSMRMGDLLTLGGAVGFGLQIVLIAKYAPGRNIYVLTMWQFATVAVCSLPIALFAEPLPAWSAMPQHAWPALLYLAVVVTAVALLFQNIGQTHVPPSSAALLLSFESVFGAAFSIGLGMEDATLRVLVGFALVFVAVLISEWLPTVWWRRKGQPLEEAEQ